MAVMTVVALTVPDVKRNRAKREQALAEQQQKAASAKAQ